MSEECEVMSGRLTAGRSGRHGAEQWTHDAVREKEGM
jgi:hypothetical protein